MIGSKGQQWEVMKLLQGGVIAVLIFSVVFAVVSYTKGQTPQADVYSVSCEIIGDAFAARDTKQYFVREAMLVEQEVDSLALIHCSGLPSSGVTLNLHCVQGFCVYDGKHLDGRNDCDVGRGCNHMSFVEGATISVCAICEDDACSLWFGENECAI